MGENLDPRRRRKLKVGSRQGEVAVQWEGRRMPMEMGVLRVGLSQSL